MLVRWSPSREGGAGVRAKGRKWSHITVHAPPEFHREYKLYAIENGLTMQQLADRTLAHARSGLSKATDLEEDAARRLLMTGMNPGGDGHVGRPGRGGALDDAGRS